MAHLSQLSSSLPLPSPASPPLSSSFPAPSSDVLPLKIPWVPLLALFLLFPPACPPVPTIHPSTFSTASLITPAASDSSSLTLNRAWMLSR